MSRASLAAVLLCVFAAAPSLAAAPAPIPKPATAAPAPRGDASWQPFEDAVARAKASMMGDPSRALQLARDAERIAESHIASGAKTQALATAAWLQAEALTRTNHTDQARPLIDRGLELAAQDGKDTKLDGDLNIALARLAVVVSDPETALRSFQRAHNIFAAIGEARSQSIALQGLGSIYTDAHDYEHVLEYYGRASRIFSGDPALDMSAANNLGNALKQLGRYDEALVKLDQALAIAVRVDSALLQARILTNISSVHALRGDLSAAQHAADRALRLLARDDSAGWSRFAWGIKAEIEYKRGKLDAAVADMAKAFDDIDLKTSNAPYRDIHEIAYKIYRDKGWYAAALAHHEAFKRLEDQAREVSASANLALMGARFDFATQQLEIGQLKTEQLERDVRLAKADANLQMILLASVLAISVLAISWIGWSYFSIRRHRNAINAANVTLQTTVDDLNAEIGRRKQTEEQLRVAKEGAEQANRSKTQFLANMSHELRTPLNAVIGFADIMSKEMMGPIGTPAYKQYAKDILASGNHLFEILSDILDMARIDAGKIKVTDREFNINDAIRDALRMFQEDVRQSGKTLVFAPGGAEFRIRADERLTRQILINLVSNAVKYTKDNARIEVRVEGRPNYGLDLIVADNGIGIPREKFDVIMEPFGQVEDAFARSKGGIGLGLPLVKSLVELHGGTLTIESELGQGTTARVHFPPVRLIAGVHVGLSGHNAERAAS